MTDSDQLKAFKTPEEFAALGFSLAYELDARASRLYCKDDDSWRLPEDAEELRAKAQGVLKLCEDGAVRARLESSPLLRQATPYPTFAPEAMRLQQFEQLYNLVIGFAHAGVRWEVYAATNPQDYAAMWAAPQRWAQAFQAEQQLAAAAIRQHRTEKLALAQARLVKPLREALCFAERRNNGLNCNRGDLVEIKQLPMIVAPSQQVEVSIKRCSQCWQIYKEYFVVDAVTRQSRSRFLKPDETDAESGFYFSDAEAAAYSEIDFSALLNPGLPQVKGIPDE